MTFTTTVRARARVPAQAAPRNTQLGSGPRPQRPILHLKGFAAVLPIASATAQTPSFD